MILVTGAGGFLGRHVVRALVEQGRKVRCFVHRPEQAELFNGMSVDVADGDVTNVDTLSEAMRGCSTIIHLVGIIVQHHNSTFEKIHFKGTAVVIEAARRNKINRVIFVSGMGASADVPSRYLRSKWQAEEALRSSNLDFIILRPSIIFGPDDSFVKDFERDIRRAPFIPMPGGGKTKIQPVWVDDVAAIIAECAGREELGRRDFDVGGAQELSMKEAVSAIMKASGLRRPLISIPYWMAVLPAFFLELIMTSPPLTREKLLMLRHDAFTCDVTPIIKEFKVDLISCPSFRDKFDGASLSPGISIEPVYVNIFT
jgi:uncharacterized protein YbjT (DUF2867 family)